MPEDKIANKELKRFGNEVLTLAGGTTIAQVVIALFSPVISRLYSVSQIGVYSLFNSFVNVLGKVTCLRYETTIPLPKEDEKAGNLFLVSTIITIFFSTILTIIVGLFGPNIFRLLNAEELTPFGYLIPLAVLLQGIFLAVNYWETRKRRFKHLSKRRVTNSALTVIWQGAAAALGFGSVFNLIFGSVFGSLVANLQMLIDMLRHDIQQIFGSFSLKDLINDAKSYKEFPIYGIPAILLNSLSSNVPIFILSFFFSTSIVGYYGFGFRVLRMPMDLIGVSIYQAFLPRAAQAYKDGNLAWIVRFTYEKLIKISFFPLAVIAFSGGPIFSLIFGDQWRIAGEYIQIMSLYVIFWFIANPISSLFSILNKQRSLLVFNIFNFISRVISLSIGGLLSSERMAILLYSISGIILYIMQNIVILKWAGIDARESIRTFLSSVIWPLLFASSMVLVTYITDNTIIIFSYFVVLICGYYFWLFSNDKEFKELFSFNPKEKNT